MGGVGENGVGQVNANLSRLGVEQIVRGPPGGGR